MCSMPQMAEDVVNTVRGKTPVYSLVTGHLYPTISQVIEEAKKALEGKGKEV